MSENELRPFVIHNTRLDIDVVISDIQFHEDGKMEYTMEHPDHIKSEDIAEEVGEALQEMIRQGMKLLEEKEK